VLEQIHSNKNEFIYVSALTFFIDTRILDVYSFGEDFF